MSQAGKSNSVTPRPERPVVVTERSKRSPISLLYRFVALLLVATAGGYLVSARGGSIPWGSTRRSLDDGRLNDTAAKDMRRFEAPLRPWPTLAVRAMTPRRIEPTPSPTLPDEDNRSDGTEDTTPDLATFLPRGELPSTAEVIERLNDMGIHSGIAAFPPPGTSPPLVGLAVPEEFELPEGYVRHYQSTDDGLPIEPILMFSPDFEFFDKDGKPIAIPEDRVVPPDLAPAGMSLRSIEIPRPLDSQLPED